MIVTANLIALMRSLYQSLLQSFKRLRISISQRHIDEVMCHKIEDVRVVSVEKKISAVVGELVLKDFTVAVDM